MLISVKANVRTAIKNFKSGLTIAFKSEHNRFISCRFGAFSNNYLLYYFNKFRDNWEIINALVADLARR